MASHRFTGSTVVRGASLSVVAAAFLMTGCANTFQTTASSVAPQVKSIGGTLHGGNQPITNSLVSLYSAGTTGYGTGSVLLAQVTSNSQGAFNFNQSPTPPAGISNFYTCPSPNSLLYIVSSGGNTLGTTDTTTNNSASVLIGAIGACSGASNVFIDINEVTTVATVAALAQYINPGTSTPGTVTMGTASDYTVATPAQSGLGLKNAFAAVNNLVTPATGAAVASFTATGTNATVSAVTVTGTPEVAKVNTIANILASCVNQVSATSDTNCSALFTNAVPPSAAVTSQPNATFNPAVDTLQAAYYMLTNPTDGGTTALGNLYVIANPTPPFAPALAAQPTDWTIGIVYNSGSTVCSNGAPFLNYAYQNGVDASGNIWNANGGSFTPEAMTQMSPLGVPLACSGPVVKARGGAVLDTLGNAWVASNTTAAVYKFDGATTTTIATTNGTNYAMAADGKGNIFFTDTTGPNLYEVKAGTTTAILIGKTAGGSSPYGMAVDSKGTVVIGQSGSGGSVLTAFPTTTVGGSAYSATPVSITSATNYAGVYGVAFDASGAFAVANSAGTGSTPGNTSSKTALTYGSTVAGAANTVTFTPGTPTAVAAGGLATARIDAIDGAGNIWFGNNTAISSLYGVTELNSSLAPLSPSTGFQKAATYFVSLRGVAIDPSGNVWITSTGASGSATTVGNTFVTELVGSAVPVVTPISVQAANNTFATKP